MNHQAIYNTHSNVTSIDDTEGAFDIDGNSVTIDQSLVDTEIARLQSDYDGKQYARDRAEAYPSIADQLDMLWHAIDQGIDLKQSDFYTGNKAVKDAHPKG